MSYVAGTGLISGNSGSSTTQNIQINLDHEQVLENKDNITSLTSTVNNLTTNDISEGTNNLYYTDQRFDDRLSTKTELVRNDDITDVVRTGDITDVVRTGDITDVVRDSDITDVVRTDDITDVVRTDDITDVVRDSDITDVVRDSDITDVVRDSDITDVVRTDDITDVVRTDDITDVVRTDDITDVVRTNDITDFITLSDVPEGDKILKTTPHIYEDNGSIITVNSSRKIEAKNDSIDLTIENFEYTAGSYPIFGKVLKFINTDEGIQLWNQNQNTMFFKVGSTSENNVLRLQADSSGLILSSEILRFTTEDADGLNIEQLKIYPPSGNDAGYCDIKNVLIYNSLSNPVGDPKLPDGSDNPDYIPPQGQGVKIVDFKFSIMMLDKLLTDIGDIQTELDEPKDLFTIIWDTIMSILTIGSFVVDIVQSGFIAKMMAGNKITSAISDSITSVADGITNRSLGYEILDEANLLDGYGNIPDSIDYKYIKDDDFFTGIIKYLTRRNQAIDVQPLLSSGGGRRSASSTEFFNGFGQLLGNYANPGNHYRNHFFTPTMFASSLNTCHDLNIGDFVGLPSDFNPETDTFPESLWTNVVSLKRKIIDYDTDIAHIFNALTDLDEVKGQLGLNMAPPPQIFYITFMDISNVFEASFTGFDRQNNYNTPGDISSSSYINTGTKTNILYFNSGDTLNLTFDKYLFEITSQYYTFLQIKYFTSLTSFKTISIGADSAYISDTASHTENIIFDENTNIRIELIAWDQGSIYSTNTINFSVRVPDSSLYYTKGEIDAFGFSTTDTTYTGGTGITINGTTIHCDVVNTDTTYTGGTGITINGTTINCDVVNTDTTYTGGTGITINGTTINCDVVNTDTTYTGGTGISIEGTTINCDVVNTDTTYTGGTGISIEGTTINCDVVNTDTTYSSITELDVPALPQDNKVLSSTATGLEWVEIAQPDLTQYYNKTEIDHKILGGVADDDFSSKNISGIVKHKYNDGDNYIWVSQNLYPSEINGLQEFMNNAITIQSVENQFPVLQTFTADSFLELATDQKVLYITLTQYSPLKIEYQYGTGSVITHTYTTFNELGYPHWLNINISQYDYIAFRITAPFEFRLRFEKYWLDPEPIYATTQSTSYTSPQQITLENGSLYLHHDNGDGTGGYHRIINFILDPPRYQNKFQSSVIPPDTTKIDYMNFINSGGTHYLRIGRNDVYSDINLDVNLGWLAGANHNHDLTYAPKNHNHDGVYLKTVDDVFVFMDRSKFEIDDDNRINLKGNLSYFTESSSTDSIGTATTTLSYNGNIDITGELDCVNVTVDSLTFRDNSYITSATGLGSGGGGGGVVNYTDIQVPTITETVPGNLITVDVTPTVAPDHYYIDQSPVTEYTVLQTDATNLRIHYKFDNSASLFENSAPSSANPISLTFTSRTSTNNDGVYSTTDSIIGGSFYKSDPADARGYSIEPRNWLATNFNTSKQATFAFWVKNTESSNAYSHILRQDSSFIIRQYNTEFQVYLAPDNFASYDKASSDVLTYNTWVHIAVVINLTSGTIDNDVVKIYRNGVELATTVNNSYSTMIGVGFQNDNSVCVFAGAGGTTNGFKGYLDDFRIYDTVLTGDEISLLYNQKVLVNIEPQDIPGTTDYKTLTFTYQNDYITDFQLNAEAITGVLGWKLVKYKPISDVWFSGNDNIQGNYELNHTTKLSTEEWAITWDDSTQNEVLFVKGNFVSWLRCNASSIDATNWTNPTALGGNKLTDGKFTMYRNESGWTTSPYIFDHTVNYSDAYGDMIYQERQEVGYGGVPGASWPDYTDDSYYGPENYEYYVLVRNSSATSSVPANINTEYDLTFDNPTEGDILIVDSIGVEYTSQTIPQTLNISVGSVSTVNSLTTSGGTSSLSSSITGTSISYTSSIVIIRYKTTTTTGSASVTITTTPRGVLKYNTNDEWSLSTISQTDIADLEQNSIIQFLLRQSLELHKRVYQLETSTPVLWDTIGIYEYKYEYGNDWAIIKDNNETFTISNRRVTNNLFIRLVNYYPKTDNNYLLKSGLPQLIDDTTLPLQIYNFKYGDTLPLNPTIKINSSEICQLTLNEASYVTAIRIQISYTGYDNTFAYANLPASITVPINDVIIIKILDIDTYIPGEREYYYRTTVSNTGSSFPIVEHKGFLSEDIFPEVIALSATSTIYRLGLDVYTGGVQPATATENIAMSIDINVV